MQQEKTTLPTQKIDALLDNLKQDETQMALAEKAENALFASDEAKKNTFQTINTFLDDYLLNGRHQPIDQWLKFRFDQYPDIWESEQEKIDTANMIISTIENLVANQVELEKHINKRKTVENFYQKKINQVAENYQINANELSQEVDASLAEANRKQFGFLTGEVIDVPFEEKPLNEKTIQRAKLNANLNLAFYGAKSVGSRLANAFLGKENLSHTEELQKIIRGAVDSAENKGVQVAVSGGVVVSAKKGWIKDAFEGLDKIEGFVGKAGAALSRVQDLTLNVAKGWHDIRLFDGVERGLHTATDVIAEQAKFGAAQLITAVETKANLAVRAGCANVGRGIGATVGSIFGPVGTAVGSVVGGFVGNAVGGIVNEVVVKPIANIARTVANVAIDTVSSVVKGAASFVSGVASAAGSVLSALNPFNWF